MYHFIVYKLGSLKKRCLYIPTFFQNSPKLTYLYNSLQLSTGMNTSGSKTPTTFFCYQQFFFFLHTTQHNIQNTTKQNNRHILNISRSNQKGGGEGRTTRTQKSLLYIITYVQQKTLPSINDRRPGPTDSRRCTFTWHYTNNFYSFSHKLWLQE